MREHIVLTATGRDRPGVVERMAEQIVAAHGNVESSRMARLGGEFAMVMLISIDRSSLDALETGVHDLREEGFDIRLRTTAASDARSDATSACGVTVTGADHQGIIHQIARHLAERQINIETMDTNVYQAPMSGVPLFAMSAVVHLPQGVSPDALAKAMAAFGHELGVEIHVSSSRS